MSAWTCRSSDGKADPKIVPPRPRIPGWKGLGADSEEKREPVSDIDTAVVDSLKVLDLKWPIREADIGPANLEKQSAPKPAHDGPPLAANLFAAAFTTGVERLSRNSMFKKVAAG